jgi:hypothetical protein
MNVVLVVSDVDGGLTEKSISSETNRMCLETYVYVTGVMNVIKSVARLSLVILSLVVDVEVMLSLVLSLLVRVVLVVVDTVAVVVVLSGTGFMTTGIGIKFGIGYQS